MKKKLATGNVMLALAFVLGIGLMLSGMACGILWPWPGQCGTDADCADGETCANGQCVTQTAECTSDADCPTGQVCQSGHCVPEAAECTTDADCDDGLYCTGTATCVQGDCQAGTDPCAIGTTCNEDTDTCDPMGSPSPYATHDFDHDFHATFGCEACHHIGNVGCDAEGCHAEEWIGGVPNLKEAMHETCGTCHTDTTADELWDCTKCHTSLLDL
ncbi:MAG: cytochrome c3 family protein [bacterium]|nr:cytochrome c3 family protein [bacterium]